MTTAEVCIAVGRGLAKWAKEQPQEFEEWVQRVEQALAAPSPLWKYGRSGPKKETP